MIQFFLLRRFNAKLCAKFCGQYFYINFFQQIFNRFAVDFCDVFLWIVICKIMILFWKLRKNFKKFIFWNKIFQLQPCRSRICHYIRFIVYNFFKILVGNSKNVTDLARQRTEIPNVYDRYCKSNMLHPFATNTFLCFFNTSMRSLIVDLPQNILRFR